MFSFQVSANSFPDPNLPGIEPELFAEGIISVADRHEFRLAIHPNGKHILFSEYSKDAKGYRILASVQSNGVWQQAKPLSFLQVGDLEPAFSPDGKWLYFTSQRPPAKGKEDANLWRVAWNEGQGGTAEILSVATSQSEWVANLTNNGHLYFARFNADDKGDIVLAESDGPGKLLPAPINTIYSDFEPYVDAEEKLMIFSSDRPGGLGGADLYLSFRIAGDWQTPINLGAKVNSRDGEYSPFLTQDKRFLIFSRDGDFYWLDFQALLKKLKIDLKS